MLLANLRWEWGLVKFLKLSGVGRTMADGTDEDGAYAARMDEWVAWKEVSLRARVDFAYCFLLYISSSHPFIRGARTQRPAHSVRPRVEDWLLVFSFFFPFVFPRPHIPWGWMASSQELNK